METLEQVVKLKEYVAEVFQGLRYLIAPRYPYVLVRLIPKEQTLEFGKGVKLYLPDSAGVNRQNKPVYEGQVLKVYKPIWKQFRGSIIDDGDGNKTQILERHFHSPVAVGDHIVFEHFRGVPIPNLCHDWKKGEYRLVDQADILATLEYDQMTIRQRLEQLIDENTTTPDIAREPHFDVDGFIDELLDRANVVFSEQSKTLSGV